MKPLAISVCLLASGMLSTAVLVKSAEAPPPEIEVELLEGLPKERTWDFDSARVTTRYTQPTFAFVRFPHKYTQSGVIADRTNPILLRAQASLLTPSNEAGEHEVILRARGAARLYVDDELIAETKFLDRNADGHEAVPQLTAPDREDLRPLPPGCQEARAVVALSAGKHEFRLEAIVGGPGLRLELNDLCVAMAPVGEPLQLLSAYRSPRVGATEEDWQQHAAFLRRLLSQIDSQNRRTAAAKWAQFWRQRHEFAREVVATWPEIEIPNSPTNWPIGNAVDRFLAAGMTSAGVLPAPIVDDFAFLRRITLDTVGVVPTRQEIAEFQSDDGAKRRSQAIDRLLDDPRWADHWVSYWQDVLAENPGILKPELNNTGPFRWWIYESLVDNKPMDRFVTELVMMAGSKYYGGPAGFGMASQNDAPRAAKAHVLAQAFLGVEMKCARCHDAPYHPYKQEQLFSLAAMLNRRSIDLPRTSTVPVNPGGRVPLVEISLKPGQEIAPAWPFPELSPTDLPEELLIDVDDPRQRLAGMLTSPHNRRFAQVVVNRLWARTMGRGLVEPVDDWATDGDEQVPPLLDYLARELVAHDYDLKHVARLIFNSFAYQAQIASPGEDHRPELFASPVRRRLTAEQLVDSLLVVSGKEMNAEWLTLDPEGRRPVESFLNLGLPSRAWQFTSLSNERDRPALALPVAQGVVDLLLAYGWRDARPNPITVRDETPTLLQPLALANGIVGRRAVRLSDDGALTEVCLADVSLAELVDQVSRQVFSRPSTAEESRMFAEFLSDGFESRVITTAEFTVTHKARPRHAVSWSNHLSAEATEIKLQLERDAQAGDPPTARLETDWRERMEDVLWAMINSPEFVFVP